MTEDVLTGRALLLERDAESAPKLVRRPALRVVRAARDLAPTAGSLHPDAVVDAADAVRRAGELVGRYARLTTDFGRHRPVTEDGTTTAAVVVEQLVLIAGRLETMAEAASRIEAGAILTVADAITRKWSVGYEPVPPSSCPQPRSIPAQRRPSPLSTFGPVLIILAAYVVAWALVQLVGAL